MNRGAIAEINLSAIANNLNVVRKTTNNRPVIAVVKADAYGHGAVGVSRKLLQEGVPYLAVAYVGEAKTLRDEGITAPIIVLFDGDETEAFFDLALIPVVYSKETAASLSSEALKRKTVKKIHVKIDTGMGRLGLHGDTIIEDITAISEMPGIEIEGLLSHFSEADLADRSYALLQLERFNAIQKTLSGILKKNVFAHFANSAAVLTLRDAYFDAVRPGIMLYGHSPISQKQNPPVPPSEREGQDKPYVPYSGNDDKIKDSLHKKHSGRYADQLRKDIYYKKAEQDWRDPIGVCRRLQQIVFE